MKTRSTRLALSVCLLGSLLTIVLGASTARAQATATSLGNCATSGAPSLFPFGAYDPVVFSTNFTGSSVPSSWWVARYATTFNQYTIHDPGNVIFSSAGMQLTNSPDPNGKQQDMGIAGESPILATSGEMPGGYQGDNMLMAWCARVTSDRDIDTDFELGQASSRPWPPEIDLAEGAGSTLTVILHWTCDSSITGCPRTDGDFNGTVAPSGGYSPWPPPGVKVGDHYTCDEITNGRPLRLQLSRRGEPAAPQGCQRHGLEPVRGGVQPRRQPLLGLDRRAAARHDYRRGLRIPPSLRRQWAPPDRSDRKWEVIRALPAGRRELAVGRAADRVAGPQDRCRFDEGRV